MEEEEEGGKREREAKQTTINGKGVVNKRVTSFYMYITLRVDIAHVKGLKTIYICGDISWEGTSSSSMSCKDSGVFQETQGKVI